MTTSDSPPISPDRPTWGSGYGARRHLVEQSTFTTEGAARDRFAQARCREAIHLSFFDNGPEEERRRVLRRTPCAMCHRIVLKEQNAAEVQRRLAQPEQSEPVAPGSDVADVADATRQ
jgi:hypothetical protein